ncbi:MAG: hypothetical protein NTY35_13495 [Planctomycetota bacterium]|nr:hypothetical protein [Planctomycetota bacterium]
MIHAVLTHLILFSGQATALPRPQDLGESLQAFRAAHGANWQVVVDAETGFAEMLHGGGAQLGSVVRTDAEARTLADAALLSTLPVHGVAVESLEFERVMFLPLGQIGSSDKWTVRYTQRLGGLPVEGAKVNVLMDSTGRVLSVHSTAVAGVDTISSLPTFAPESALAVAGDAFLAKHHITAADASRPVLAARRALVDGRRTARAAWTLDLSYEPTSENPISERYWIDAREGSILAVENQIHYFDVTGTVLTKATPGTAPDTASNPETDQVMRYARVQSSAGTVITNASGAFNFPGVNTPLAVTVTYYGDFNNVANAAGAAYTLTQTVQPNTPTTITMNPSPTDQITAQANAMIGVNLLRDFVRALNPTDATADIRFLSNVNQSQTCNAFFNGNSINFFLSGGGCPNTCYSTVVSHEHGHWMNVLYGTGNGPDGMGEGNADVWAMYIWDTPVVAQDFFGVGSPIRTGLNNQAFCGDASPSCYGEVHADGEPWMGAAWKVRNRLNQTNGNAPGDLIANTIFLAWMNGYNQTQIRSIIETQWLTLDDNDANLSNGTPHFADIDGGFRDQGFPGVTLVPLAIANVTALPDTENAAGPYVVDASISANFSPPLTATTLRWRVNGGAFTDVPMSFVSGSTYRASIPGLPYPSLVQYSIRAVDSAARVVTWPPSAPEQLQAFDVGTKNQIATYSFDSTASGWTTGTVGDTSNPEVDWVRGSPQGRGGNVGGVSWRDPSTAFAGTGCFANDLGTGANDGAYSANVHSWLRSPILNMTGRQNVRLRFQSWLSVDGNALDQARVLVNGTEFYANPALARSDTGWGMQEYDISSVAANNPSVQVEFRLRSNGTNQFGGWAIDDVNLFALSPIVEPCPAPQSFCVAAPNSVGGGAQMGYAGTGNLVLNNLQLFVYACPPNVSGLFFYGPNATQVPFGNGFRCVSGSTFRLGVQTTDSFGDATRVLDLGSLPSGPALAGQVWKFQFWYRNPAAGGAGFNLSNGLSVTVCN